MGGGDVGGGGELGGCVHPELPLICPEHHLPLQSSVTNFPAVANFPDFENLP